MNRIIHIDQAITKLKRMTQAESSPVIEDELADILDECMLASLWLTATPYRIGDVVQPNVPDGHRYVCISPGTSGATEPNFDTGRDSETSDGDDLVWQEAGPEYACLWDLTLAAHRGWTLKASKALCAIDSSGDGQSAKNSQVFDHCEKMAMKFAPVMIG
jgi:hypothetical protein